MSAPYDHHALWLKAKMFLNRAMDDLETRPFEERALWASLSLELLAKAALARVSPLLVAEPTEDGANLLIASGLIEGDARFKSVRAKTLYARCHRAFRPFNETEAGKITHARNEYLHGSAAGFTSIPEAAWWPRYWTLAVVLVHAMERQIEDLVGIGRSRVVEDHLKQNKKNIEQRTEMLISRARQRLAQYEGGTLPARVAEDWAPGQDRRAGLQYATSEACPACSGWGTIESDESIDVSVLYEQVGEDDFDIIIDVTAASEYFSCADCGLVLDGLQLIREAGVGETFSTEGTDEDVVELDDGYEYGND